MRFNRRATLLTSLLPGEDEITKAFACDVSHLRPDNSLIDMVIRVYRV
jgi:hypothetical protein